MPDSDKKEYSMKKQKIEIIYQDQDVLVINKATGMSVTKDRSGTEDILMVLHDQLGRAQADRLLLVHRLDKLTSGVMVLAKKPEIQSQLTSDFEHKRINKTYLALVSGFVPQPQGIIKAPLARSLRDPKQMCVSSKRGKQAITKWKLLADFGTVALLAVSPVTGRTHQIRVHLPSAGMPLAIDPLYGSSRGIFLSDFKQKYRISRTKEEKPLIDRLTLHAYQLDLAESKQEKPAPFVAALDKKFAATIKMLAKHSPNGTEVSLKEDYRDNILNADPLHDLF